jgi:type III secretion system FlhB-like substrate exporter
MKKTTKTFAEQLYEYYNFSDNNTDENLDFIFSKDNGPDVILSSSDETIVALKYESEEMSAPMIKTKGKNEFAKQILNIAKKKEIPVIKNDELTRKLYSKVSIDSLLPAGFYEDIAAIYRIPCLVFLRYG